MKKIIFLLIIFICLFSAISVAKAIPNPAPVYCAEMGYTVEGENCVFPDGVKCEQWAFYNGACGAQYVKTLACKKSGESLTPGSKCCEGLTSIGVKVGSDTSEICPMMTGAWSICAPCGNGTCDVSVENHCNCPQDCKIVGRRAGSENTKDVPVQTKTEVKIMPSTASATAIQRLGEVKNVQIELKTIGSDKTQNPVYEFKAQKPAKMFGFIPMTMNVSSEINADTGTVISVKKPWWSFLTW